MIDIMALRQSYERRELFEIRWINGQDNPADVMTKANLNKALETFVDTNTLRVRVEGWVKREQEQDIRQALTPTSQLGFSIPGMENRYQLAYCQCLGGPPNKISTYNS